MTHQISGTRFRVPVSARRALSLAIAATLAIATTDASAAQSAQSAEIDTLRAQMQALQQRLDQLQARQDQQDAKSAELQSQNQQTQQQVAKVEEATKKVETASSKPILNAGPLTFTLGGFTELAGIYRSRTMNADIASSWNGIPYANSANHDISEFRGSARQSRLSLLIQGPDDGHRAAEAYFEGDFLGAARTANSNESNSYNPRIRHAYADYWNKDSDWYVLGGQTWSLVTAEKVGMAPRNEMPPLTIDAQYVPGFSWTRNPQLRFVDQFAKGVWGGISFESPQTLVYNGPNPPLTSTVFSNPGGSGYDANNNYSIDFMPDIVGKLAFDPSFGHYEVFGLGRGFRARAGGSNDTTYGGGIGGNMLLPLIPKTLDLTASFLTGRGVGRYGSVQLPDVTVKPDGTLSPVRNDQVLLGLVFRPDTFNTAYAYERSFIGVKPDGTMLPYGYGSPGYDNSTCDTSGGAAASCVGNTRSVTQFTMGDWFKFYQGDIGNMQFGLQASYTKRKSFDGIGGAPDTDDTIVMASFRYYPFQK
jgi:TolA-binding protein